MDNEQKEITEIVKSSMFPFLMQLKIMRDNEHADINYILDNKDKVFSDIIFENAGLFAEYLIKEKDKKQ